jgi:hypothetical protein
LNLGLRRLACRRIHFAFVASTYLTERLRKSAAPGRPESFRQIITSPDHYFLCGFRAVLAGGLNGFSSPAAVTIVVTSRRALVRSSLDTLTPSICASKAVSKIRKRLKMASPDAAPNWTENARVPVPQGKSDPEPSEALRTSIPRHGKAARDQAVYF